MTIPHTLDEIREIIEQVSYKDWRFHVMPYGAGYVLQLRFCGAGAADEQRSRKWILSSFACRSEIVQTALKAVLAAEEHEARELFRYKGRPVFGPHYNVDKLHELLAHEEALDVRPPMGVHTYDKEQQ
jgi:hypothetical protein